MRVILKVKASVVMGGVPCCGVASGCGRGHPAFKNCGGLKGGGTMAGQRQQGMARRTAASRARSIRASLCAAVGEIAIGGVDTQWQGARLEAEERAQLMVDHQRVALAATGGGQKDGGVDQCVLVDEVEEVLEQPVYPN